MNIEKIIQHNSNYHNQSSTNEKSDFHDKVLKCANKKCIDSSHKELLEKLASYSPNTEKEELYTSYDELKTVKDDTSPPLDNNQICLLIFSSAFMARMLQPDYLLSYDDD
ncbi:hypothetical protein [Pectobacterium polaris]|uniref:hypothetical protein n=1 Tax=Pectobacterium polaris TaxID=2042057 RepID=UPI0013FDFC7A|nr:hypothetical protein [Pectobacterium polaris]